MKSLKFVSLVVLILGCSNQGAEDDSLLPDPNDSHFEELPPTIGSLSNGSQGFCTNTTKCSSGQGDCNTNAGCQIGLVCVFDKGSLFGFAPTVDMCLPSHCGNGMQDADESGVDCGGENCGLCPVCPDPSSNGAADFCSNSCRCDVGEGDCDADSQCSGGLICGLDRGVFYEQAASNDVCVIAHCGDNVQNADETDVDCGGEDCGDCISHALPPGHGSYCSPTNRCTHGQGDCDNDAHCVPGNTCQFDVGATYGLAASVDVCVTTGPVATCGDGMQNQGELGVDCGGPCKACTASCSDGQQNQGETGVDCGGPCGSCLSTFTFVDTSGADDIAPTAIFNFFSGLTPKTTDYILVSVGGSSQPPFNGEFCFERADWYVSNYLALSPTSGSAQSEAWQKWARTTLNGTWSDAYTTVNQNYFGGNCATNSVYAWCVEWGSNGQLMAIQPNSTTNETFNPTNTVTIKVGATRSATCGF